MEDEIYPFVIRYNLIGPSLNFFNQDGHYPRVCYIPAKNQKEAKNQFNNDLRFKILQKARSLHIRKISEAISVSKLEIDGHKILAIPLEQLANSP
ncbi:hypothetical protein CMI38_03140 [Candidatus Pacearchaeota archaeon]|nr:hypothetical protein [Candidatus Pacearchaeota archaeon]|tara:strand:- start:12483 stop:12767 length:285 start_codon:yes stop_codon:yes gene_type:complete